MSSLNVNTINEYTSANGVTIDGALIKDSKLASTAGGSLVLLQTGTASNSSELVFDDFVDLSTYPSYYIVMSRIKPVNDNIELQFAFRQGGSSGSDLTGTYYQGGYYVYVDHSNGAGNFGNNSETDYHTWDNNIGNGSAEACVGEATLFPATGSTNDNVTAMNHINMKQRSDDTMRYIQRATFKEDVTAVTGIRFFFQTGNIASGTIRIYGVKS